MTKAYLDPSTLEIEDGGSGTVASPKSSRRLGGMVKLDSNRLTASPPDGSAMVGVTEISARGQSKNTVEHAKLVRRTERKCSRRTCRVQGWETGFVPVMIEENATSPAKWNLRTNLPLLVTARSLYTTVPSPAVGFDVDPSKAGPLAELTGSRGFPAASIWYSWALIRLHAFVETGRPSLLTNWSHNRLSARERQHHT